MPAQSRAAVAARDLGEGLRRYWMWSALAMQDMRLRYRGSVLGPFWVTLSTLVMVVAMGFIYSHLFHTDVRTYMPYLTLGLIVWQLISSLITEACQVFLENQQIIQQVPVPFSVHVYREVCRNFIVFGHNLAIVPIGLAVFSIPIGWESLQALAGTLLLAVNGISIGLILGILSTRFRDIAPIVASLLQVVFFLTPIFWPIDALGKYRPIAEFNPLFAAIDVIRAPLLGVPVSAWSWPVLIAATALTGGISFLLFARFRGRIAYWV